MKEIKIGDVFGRLTITARSGMKKHGRFVWECVCKCGKAVCARSDLLRCGKIQSCGCLREEALAKNAKKAYASQFIDGTSLSKLKANSAQRNNTSGVRGVSWHKGRGKWVARISLRGKTYSLGYYDSIDEATKVHKQAEIDYHAKTLNEINSRIKETEND